MDNALKLLNQQVIACTLCPRLVNYRENAPAKPPFDPSSYWRKPVPGFGDPKAWLFILGLAPAPQGGNRTGRIFTGDKSGAFLMKALHAQGFANHPYSLDAEDGLILKGCYITASVKCVPPDHRPIRSEFLNCNRYLKRELELLPNVQCILALGQGALEAFMIYAKKKIGKFKHGEIYQIEGLPTLFASYHPSPQNTNTGKLSEKMFIELLEEIKSYHARLPKKL